MTTTHYARVVLTLKPAAFERVTQSWLYPLVLQPFHDASGAAHRGTRILWARERDLGSLCAHLLDAIEAGELGYCMSSGLRPAKDVPAHVIEALTGETAPEGEAV